MLGAGESRARVACRRRTRSRARSGCPATPPPRRASADGADGVEAVPRRRREPRVPGDGGLPAPEQVGARCDLRRHLQGDACGSACTQNGAHPAGSVTGRACGSPPSGSVCAASQSQSPTASGVVGGVPRPAPPARASPPRGWLPGERRSGSSPSRSRDRPGAGGPTGRLYRQDDLGRERDAFTPLPTRCRLGLAHARRRGPPWGRRVGSACRPTAIRQPTSSRPQAPAASIGVIGNGR